MGEKQFKLQIYSKIYVKTVLGVLVEISLTASSFELKSLGNRHVDF